MRLGLGMHSKSLSKESRVKNSIEEGGAAAAS